MNGCNLGNVTSNGKDPNMEISHTGGIAGNFTPGYKVARMTIAIIQVL